MRRTPFVAVLARENWVLDIFRGCYTMREIKQVHAQIIKIGFHQNVYVVGRIISFCAASDEKNSMDYATRLFDDIEYPDGFLWNTMIRGYGKAGLAAEAFDYYGRMRANGGEGDSFNFSFLLKICSQKMVQAELGKQVHCSAVKSGLDLLLFVRNTLVHMYGMFKDLSAARVLFDEMAHRCLVSWNTIIDVHAHCGEHEEALRLFRRMLGASGFDPDDATMVVVLSSCSELGNLDFGRWTHEYVRAAGLDRVVSVSNALIDMYAKCGAIDEAMGVFDAVEEAKKNAVTWNSMISGLALHGHAEAALELFSRMRKWGGGEPDGVTFVGVLSACSHGGLVDEGKRCFHMMQEEYGVRPTIAHYSCMVDLLGRAGLVREAHEVIVKCHAVECNAVVWRTLLAACRVHGDTELGEQVRRRLLELEPEHSGDYVLLSNLYACSARWKDVVEQREAMRNRGVRKAEPGNSIRIC